MNNLQQEVVAKMKNMKILKNFTVHKACLIIGLIMNHHKRTNVCNEKETLLLSFYTEKVINQLNNKLVKKKKKKKSINVPINERIFIINFNNSAESP